MALWPVYAAAARPAVRVRQMDLAAQHLRCHATMRCQGVEPVEQTELNTLGRRQSHEVVDLGGDHRPQGSPEPGVRHAV